MKKTIAGMLVLILIINFSGCAVVDSVKEVARPMQTPPPLKDTEIVVTEDALEPSDEPIVETKVESNETPQPQDKVGTEAASEVEDEKEQSSKINAEDVFKKRTDDLYIECVTELDSDSVDVSAYLSGGNINAVIVLDGTPINAVVKENYDYVYIYLDNSFFGAKVTGFEQYNPMKYEDIVLQNAKYMQDLAVDENGVNGYAAVRGMFEYNDNDYVVWYSQEFQIALKVEINQTVVYEVKKVKLVENMDMNIFEKPGGKLFVDFGDISELSIKEIMQLFN